MSGNHNQYAGTAHARVCMYVEYASSKPVLAQVEAGSYREIALALGTDSPAELLFATDMEAEAAAATAAGWQVRGRQCTGLCLHFSACLVARLSVTITLSSITQSQQRPAGHTTPVRSCCLDA